MLVGENIRRGVLTAVPMFLLIGLLSTDAAAFTKAQCTTCGCKYERECHNIDGVELCVITCSCQNGPQDSCMTKKLTGALGVHVTELPSKKIFRLPEASAPARK